jgi:hypothetical protein
MKVKTAFIFLEDIKKKFREKYSKDEIDNSTAFSMNSSFSEIFKQQFVVPSRPRPFSTATRTPTRRRR